MLPRGHPAGRYFQAPRSHPSFASPNLLHKPLCSSPALPDHQHFPSGWSLGRGRVGLPALPRPWAARSSSCRAPRLPAQLSPFHSPAQNSDARLPGPRFAEWPGSPGPWLRVLLTEAPFGFPAHTAPGPNSFLVTGQPVRSAAHAGPTAWDRPFSPFHPTLQGISFKARPQGRSGCPSTSVPATHVEFPDGLIAQAA